MRALLALLSFWALCACAVAPASSLDDSRRVLRIVPQSDLEILDPIWTTATITTNHGYLIYDTLFGTDADGHPQPQMVDTYDVSADKKTWSFRLRDGLEFHDGKPVTSEDVIASLDRWGKRDPMGQILMQSLDKWEAPDSRTFRMKLKEPYGLVLETLGKPSANVPFIMPRRVAETPATRQIDDYIGSGPFIFKKDEWKPGERVVYTKNPRYRPRPEIPTGSAGGKVAKVDRIEWVIIRDPQTQANALAAGEVDILEFPPFEQYQSLSSNPDLQMVDTNPLGNQNYLRFNHLEAPFNNPKTRQAAMAAMSQSAVLQIQVGIPGLYRKCSSVYPCNTPYSTTKGMDWMDYYDLAHARRLLKESGYDGGPVVLLHATDIGIIAKVPVLTAQLLRDAGFNVDLQSMDWQSVVSRRARKNGWSLFFTSSPSAQQGNPLANIPLSAACDKAWFGWPCDAELEKLRRDFAFAGDETQRKTIAEQVQVRAMQIGTHIPLGEFVSELAVRKTVKGLVVFGSSGFVLWNVEKD